MKLKKLLSAAMSAVLLGTSCCLPSVTAATVKEDEVLPCTLYAESVTAHPGEKGVGISVYIKDNPGYSACGIRVYYNDAITPHLDARGKLEYEVGPAADELFSDIAVNPSQKIIGFGTFTTDELEKDDGLMFTAYFDVDDTAGIGSYELKVEVDKMLNEKCESIGRLVPYQIEKGYYTLNIVDGDVIVTTSTEGAAVTTTKKPVITTAKTTTTVKTTTTTTAKTTTSTTAKTTAATTTKSTTTTAAEATTTAAGTTTATPADAGTAVIYGDNITANPGEKSVAYSVKIRNNPGFGPSALRISYPEGLTPVMKTDSTPEVTVGDIAAKLSMNFAMNKEKRYIGMVSISQTTAVGDGTIFTLYFDVSPEMQIGDYPINIEVMRFADIKSRVLPAAAETGSIQIQGSEATKLGDVDCSGAVDVADAVLLARFLAEDADAVITPAGKLNADTNKNKAPDQGDTVLILRFIARLITEF